MAVFGVAFLCAVVLLGAYGFRLSAVRQREAKRAAMQLKDAIAETEAAVDRIERDVAHMSDAVKARMNRGDGGEGGPPERVRLLGSIRDREQILEYLERLRSEAALDWRPQAGPLQCHFSYVHGAYGVGKTSIHVLFTSGGEFGKWPLGPEHWVGSITRGFGVRDLLGEWECRERDVSGAARPTTKRPTRRFLVVS